MSTPNITPMGQDPETNANGCFLLLFFVINIDFYLLHITADGLLIVGVVLAVGHNLQGHGGRQLVLAQAISHRQGVQLVGRRPPQQLVLARKFKRRLLLCRKKKKKKKERNGWGTKEAEGPADKNR